MEAAQDLSSAAIPIVTAGLKPDLFGAESINSLNRRLLAVMLSVLVVIGFGFRARGLNTEGLTEDELNKLNAVADYRAHGLTSANGEHPFVMKVLLTISVIGAEKWNQSSWAAANPALKIPVESALRIPGAVFGALSIVLLFLITAELFGIEIGLLAAALWTFDPLTIGFNRIAKEDTFLVFFFLLANVFWLRSQRIAERASAIDSSGVQNGFIDRDGRFTTINNPNAGTASGQGTNLGYINDCLCRDTSRGLRRYCGAGRVGG